MVKPARGAKERCHKRTHKTTYNTETLVFGWSASGTVAEEEAVDGLHRGRARTTRGGVRPSRVSDEARHPPERVLSTTVSVKP